MRKLFAQCALVALTLCVTLTSSADAQRRGGGGGRRGGGGGGGFRGGGGGGGGFRGGGFSRSGGFARSSARPSVTRTSVSAGRNFTNVSRGTINRGNINQGRRINTGDVNINRDWDGGYTGCCYYGGHPVARGAAWGAAAAVTSAAIGSTVYSVPSSGCSETTVNGATYVQCGSTWYRPEFDGTTTTYVVVNSP